MFVQVSSDPMEGYTPEGAQQLVEAVIKRFPLDDETENISVVPNQSEGMLYFDVPNEHQRAGLIKWLKGRNIKHVVLGSFPQATAAPSGAEEYYTHGVIFFKIIADQFELPKTKGVLAAMAMLLFEQFDGQELRAGIREYGDKAPYWVGLNSIAAGQMFAMVLKSQRVQIHYQSALPDGSRPPLKVVPPVVPEVLAPQPKHRHRPEAGAPDALSDEERAEGQGFSTVFRLAKSFGAKAVSRSMGRIGLHRRNNKGD